MRSAFLATAAALALMAATPALAERHGHDQGGSNQGGQGATQGGTQGGGQGGTWQGRSGGHQGGTQGGGGQGGGSQGGGGQGGTGSRHGGGSGGSMGGGSNANPLQGFGGGTMSGPNNSGRNDHRDRNDRNDRNRDGNRGHDNNSWTVIFGPNGFGYHSGNFGHSSHNRDYDRFRRAYRAPNRFRFGNYYKPRGWYYRRWTFGDFLPALFFARTYWITDYTDFGLPYPPPGCVWVRYGDDALLVDQYTGEIIQVVYGIFY